MPSAPALLADSIERAGVPSVVVDTRPLCRSLLRVEFELETVPAIAAEPGAHAAFRVAQTQFRHFTIAEIDPVRFRATIIAQQHRGHKGESTGAEQALATWAPGDHVNWCGIQVSRGLRWRPNSDAVLLGDASTVGLASAFARRALRDGCRLTGAVEVEADAVAAAKHLLPAFEVLTSQTLPGRGLDAWLADFGAEGKGAVAPLYYLAGGAHIIQRLRADLRFLGVPRKSILSHPFWAAGKQGLG
ncbi:hypothetical protein [Microbacterium invictum]|uniref:Siderophore-interacting protein n=1 Tax=Microbacterium invictum TaxID=515415 RepID=A0AA40VN30_9MICO|nr:MULTISPECIES: hypothetical protein [Microbacterium]MBB4140359.1 hypothetical protein [Microbacterium invictum]